MVKADFTFVICYQFYFNIHNCLLFVSLYYSNRSVTLIITLFIALNSPYPAAFLNGSIIFGSVHYHFNGIKMQT